MLDRILSVRNRSWAWFKERADGPHAVFWLALLAFLEPTFSPIVPETLLVAMLLANPARWVYLSSVAAGASIIGGIVGYFLGAALYRGVGDLVISLYGSGEWLDRVYVLFSDNVFWTMAFVTSTPVPDKIFVIIAGFLQINFALYLGGYVLGRSVRIFTVGWLVKKFGAQVLDMADRYIGWVAGAFMLLVVAAVLKSLGIISLPSLFGH